MSVPMQPMARVIRDGKTVFTGKIASIQQGKDSVDEVGAGAYCGIRFHRFNDLREGDIVECFYVVEERCAL